MFSADSLVAMGAVASHSSVFRIQTIVSSFPFRSMGLFLSSICIVEGKAALYHFLFYGFLER